MPAMPIEGIPDARRQRSSLFRYVVAQLKADATLSKVVRNWATWEGEDLESDIGFPSDDMCPWIRVTPFPDTQDAASYDLDNARTEMVIEVAVEGTNVANLMDLWECVEHALNQDAPSVTPGLDLNLDMADKHRVERHQIRKPSFGFMREGQSSVWGLYAKGLVTFIQTIQR